MSQKFAEGLKGGVPPWKEGQEIDLRIVHWCLFGPRASGMYETTRELIAAENRIEGVLAGMCETPGSKAPQSVVKKAAEGGRSDRLHPELRTQDWGWANKYADIHMIHSTMSTNVAQLSPKAYFVHGTPEACLMSELQPGDRRQSFTSSADWTERFEATFVTSHRAEEAWGAFDHTDEKVHRVTKGIDLEWWRENPTKKILDGKPSVLYGEMWRDIKHPLHLFYAVNEIFKENTEVQLNLWACSDKAFWGKILKMAYFDDFIGKYGLKGQIDYPEHWYSRGDVYFGAALFGDVSRAMQEATACGCPVITWDVDHWGDQHSYRYAKPFNIKDLADKIMEVYEEVLDDRKGVSTKCRNLAEKYFDVNQEAKQVVKVLRKVVAEQ